MIRRAVGASREVGEEFLAAARAGQRAVVAGYWAFALRGAERLIGLVRTIVLARLLAPEDFGLFGMAVLVLASMERLSQTGVRASLIHEKQHTADLLDTAWSIQAFRGVLLGLLLFLLAPAASDLFDVPAAADLFRTLALVPLLDGLTNVGVIRFEWGLDLRKRFWYQGSGTLAEALVSIVGAVLTRSPWALVFGFVAGTFVRVLASFVAHPFRPRPRIDGEAARSLFSFGRWLFLSELAIFLVTQGDDFLVALLIGPAAVGLYQMAYLLANLPATQITHVVNQVAFPLYVKIREHPRRLRLAYDQILFGITYIAFPLAAGIFVMAEEGIRILLGTTWLAAVPAVRVLAVVGGMRAFGATNGTLFNGVGRPSFNTRVTALHLALMAVLIIPLMRSYGILGAALSVAIPMVLSQAYGVWLAARIHGRWRSILSSLAAPLVGSFAVLVIATATRMTVNGDLARMAVAVPFAIIAHAALGRWIAPARLRRLLSAARPILHPFFIAESRDKKV